MYRTFMNAKLHRGHVTHTDPNYIGSITLDRNLMVAVNLAPNEQVDVLNITNGNRFTTYVIEGAPGSGTIGINGAAAHLADVGDIIIVVSYVHITESEVATHSAQVAVLDELNRVKTALNA
jgi:aspartate 1-decarboxylase